MVVKGQWLRLNPVYGRPLLYQYVTHFQFRLQIHDDMSWIIQFCERSLTAGCSELTYAFPVLINSGNCIFIHTACISTDAFVSGHVVNTLKQLDSAKMCTGNFDEKFISLVDEQDNVGQLIYTIKLFACHTTLFFFNKVLLVWSLL